MKKIFLLIVMSVILYGCEVGNFSDKRNRLHEMNSDKEICEQHPERCVSGVSW